MVWRLIKILEFDTSTCPQLSRLFLSIRLFVPDDHPERSSFLHLLSELCQCCNFLLKCSIFISIKILNKIICSGNGFLSKIKLLLLVIFNCNYAVLANYWNFYFYWVFYSIFLKIFKDTYEYSWRNFQIFRITIFISVFFLYTLVILLYVVEVLTHFI